MTNCSAITLDAPRKLRLRPVRLIDPSSEDVVVQIRYSGISTGTERLFWSGDMPLFPGMSYPLVPGYEAVGEVVEAGSQSGRRVGDRVFVPGANCFEDAAGLFGAAASCVVTSGARVSPVNVPGAEAALLALAATARHAVADRRSALPDLIIGHGVLGRLLARLTVAAGGAPIVWEIDPTRKSGAVGYEVISPDQDEGVLYNTIYDASGADGILNQAMPRLQKGGEIVLTGFYAKPVSFVFPPAFMKEARFRIAAEWQPADISATLQLLESGALSLDGLITHRSAANDAPSAYEAAFTDPACLKMILDWEGAA